ncbi:hypothetical protein B0J12DRAFT_22163 [Macrophomina phaseolina]|uniref:Transmembrane protein n=1 Tax=Macrophomina phaseolina TaxID=35725 RepID=A0ABQ8GUR7_9PEZI|nr:hypothetical protein B0J12DRAFT_22163 [Macrophomina phaseolina]
MRYQNQDFAVVSRAAFPTWNLKPHESSRPAAGREGACPVHSWLLRGFHSLSNRARHLPPQPLVALLSSCFISNPAGLPVPCAHGHTQRTPFSIAIIPSLPNRFESACVRQTAPFPSRHPGQHTFLFPFSPETLHARHVLVPQRRWKAFLRVLSYTTSAFLLYFCFFHRPLPCPCSGPSRITLFCLQSSWEHCPPCPSTAFNNFLTSHSRIFLVTNISSSSAKPHMQIDSPGGKTVGSRQRMPITLSTGSPRSVASPLHPSSSLSVFAGPGPFKRARFACVIPGNSTRRPALLPPPLLLLLRFQSGQPHPNPLVHIVKASRLRS